MATVTKGEILPCPCCAWTGWKLTHDPTCFVGQTNEKEPASDGFQIRCDKCGLQTCWWHHREQAVIAWNTRPSAQVRNEALEEAAKHPFGFYLSEMDIDAFFNMRDWLRKACEAQGAKMTGGGVGAGQADIDIELDGCSYNISIRPLPRALQSGEKGK